MINKYELLGVKKIPIYQDRDLYTFTIDSVLLASFANVKKDNCLFKFYKPKNSFIYSSGLNS